MRRRTKANVYYSPKWALCPWIRCWCWFWHRWRLWTARMLCFCSHFSNQIFQKPIFFRKTSMNQISKWFSHNTHKQKTQRLNDPEVEHKIYTWFSSFLHKTKISKRLLIKFLIQQTENSSVWRNDFADSMVDFHKTFVTRCSIWYYCENLLVIFHSLPFRQHTYRLYTAK